MINLIAANYFDAYAFVSHDGDLFSVHPPFRSKHDATAEHIARGIEKFGFTEVNIAFPDWAAVISFLTAKAVEMHSAISEPPSSDSVKDLIKIAPVAQIEKYLLKVKSDFIPNYKLNIAEAVLVRLFENPAVSENKALLVECFQLLSRCNAARTSRDVFFSNQFNEEKINRRYPYAAREFGAESVCELAMRVKKDRQLLFVGA